MMEHMREQPNYHEEILRLLVKGEQEIVSNEGYDLDEVLAKADELLNYIK